MKPVRIAVLGDGGWGTTLAILLSRNKHKVTLWSAFADYARQLDRNRINARYLPDIPIPRGIAITADVHEAVRDKDIVVLAIPSEYMRGVLRRLTERKELRAALTSASFLSTSKGIEIGSLKRMSEVIHEELGRVKLAVLSGPTIAREVALSIPTVAVIASGDPATARYLQSVFMTPTFRIYTNDDVIGVELGGSLKNVIAIACGISDGLGFGTNTKAALLARGLAEISRLGHAMGANIRTFSGISGLGDLVTTCVSPYSRNRSLGERIGAGKAVKAALRKMLMVAEGVPTAKSAYALSRQRGIDMPITAEVFRVLHRGKPPLRALSDLMTREKKAE